MLRQGGLARLRERTARARRRRRPHPIREVLLVAILFLGYKVGRLIDVGDMVEATGNARDVWRIERALHLPDEQHVQALILHSHATVRLANEFYAWVHFPAAIAFLVWMWLYRPDRYLGARRALVAMTAVSLGIHIAYPLAPPRLVPSLGLIDTAAVYGPAVYGNPHTDTLTNQFAAMPSLHIGWALLIAIILIRSTRSHWRWLWVAHPLLTTFVVVSTANHYWLDGVTAAVLIVAAIVLVTVPTDRGIMAIRSRESASAHPQPALASVDGSGGEPS